MEQRRSSQLVPSLVDLQSALTMTQGVHFEADMGSDLANVEDSSMVSRDMIHSSRSVDCLIFLKVVSTRPSSRKAISLPPAEAGVCGRLFPSDVAVTVHETRSFAGLEERCVCVCVTPSTKESPLSLQILSRFPRSLPNEKMPVSLCLHTPSSPKNLLYTIPNVCRPDFSENDKLGKS